METENRWINFKFESKEKKPIESFEIYEMFGKELGQDNSIIGEFKFDLFNPIKSEKSIKFDEIIEGKIYRVLVAYDGNYRKHKGLCVKLSEYQNEPKTTEKTSSSLDPSSLEFQKYLNDSILKDDNCTEASFVLGYFDKFHSEESQKLREIYKNFNFN